MNKTILYSAAVIIMVLLGACEREALLPDNETNPTAGRTLSLTASIPGEDNPTTKVAIEQQEDKSIALTWEAGDVLQLVFVQGTTKVKGTATVTNITNENKSGKFDIVVPEGIDQYNNFNLYGVYGPENSLSGTNFTDVILPTNPSQATSLNGTETTSIQKRKDVMLYFESKDINITTSPQVSVIFKHLGSLFSITLKNTGTTAIADLQEAQLVGVTGGNVNWAYNSTAAQAFDLVAKQFKGSETAGNVISFKAATNSLPAEATTTFWGWYPPLPNKNWPALQLQLKNTTTTFATSTNNKPARVNPTAVGKSFSFYAEVDGTNLEFTAPPLGTDEYYIGEMGTLGTVLGENKSTITRMILKGQINAADFAVMKSQMSALTYLDSEPVTCEDNKIPSNAFGDRFLANKTIKTIILPLSITSIGNQAFRNCSGLTGNLTIPDNVTSIGDYAFYECTNLTGSLTIPDNVTSIGAYAFSRCKNFTGSLTIPDNVTSIAERAFESCTGFTGSLTIPDKVNSIGDFAFSKCKNFTGSLTIPANVTSIGEYAFYNCYGFTGSLTIPDKVTSIGTYAFDGCTGFTGSLTIPNNVTSIGEYAFYNCSGFTGSLTIPANVTSIGEYAFYNCYGFTGSLTIPANVTSIGGYAFRNCSNVTAFQFLNATPITYESNMLASGKPVTVPTEAAVTAYQTKWGTSRHAITAAE